MKKLVFNLMVLGVSVLAGADLAFAQDGSGTGLVAIGAGIAIGMAALGGTLAQGRAAGAALDSIGRNPAAAGKLLVPMILGLVFMESLVLFSWVIASNIAKAVGAH